MKKFTFGKNISRVGKIFFSLVLTLALLLSTVVFSSADGETAADFGGYATKYTHVYSPMDLITDEADTKNLKFKTDDEGNYDSSVWKFAVNGEVLKTAEFDNILNSIEDNIEFTLSGISSKYNFYCSTHGYLNSGYNFIHRTIRYTGKKGDHMSFGFTAPVSGTYEIAAPIERISGTAVVNCSITKTDLATTDTAYQSLGTEVGSKVRLSQIIKLEAGETVWLNARFAGVAVLDIGIPQAILLNNAIVETEIATTYKFRAIDYLENSISNKLTYLTTSVTSNTKAAWETGYISYTLETGTGNPKPYINQSITLPTGAEGETTVADELLLAMKPYEIILNGKQYYGKPFRVAQTSEGAVETLATAGAAGSFYPADLSASLADTTTTMYNGQALTGMLPDNGILGSAHFFRFTAPISGSATIYLNESADTEFALNNAVRVVVLKGNEIIDVIETDDEKTNTYTLNEVEAGQEITLLYYGLNKNAAKAKIGSPLVEISVSKPVYATITLDTNGGTFTKEDQANVVEIELFPTTNEEGQIIYQAPYRAPAATKKNAIHKGWRSSLDGVGYKTSNNIPITGNATLTALYNDLGNLNDDRVLDEQDIAKYKRYLLGLELITSAYAEANANQDVDKDGKDIIDICDLVCAYEFLQEQSAS